MPKLVITERDTDFPTSIAGWLHTRYIRVGWHRQSQRIQLASCDAQSGIHEHAPGAPGSDVPGLLVELDRDRVNELIHALRRARDAAFPPEP